MLSLLLPSLLLFMGSCAAPTSPPSAERTSYVSLSVSDGQKEWLLAGKLNYPKTQGNGAAVLIVHGSGGIDSRGALHTRSLNAKGFVTLEIDLWAARGWVGVKTGRPPNVPETIPDVLRAREFLASLDGVDPERIGILGFSWGGVLSMLTREKNNLSKYGPSEGFSAHVAFYPVCWVYNKVPGYSLTDLNDTPLLVLTGALDDYDEADTCEVLVSTMSPSSQANTKVVVYAGATHAFNSSAARMVVEDPFSHLGKGGEVVMEGKHEARVAADKATTQFFLDHL